MGVKISQLPPIATPDLTDIFAVVQSGVTYKETCSQLVDLLSTAADFVTFSSPSIANHIAVFTNTAGNLSDDISTAINGGNIHAGLSGTAGILSSFPASVSSGSLSLAAVTNSSGNFSTTISNSSSVLQSQVITVPDCGASTGNFLLNTSLIGQSVSVSSASSTPGALVSLLSTVTLSGSVVGSQAVSGIQGTVALVGASSGSVNGCEGLVDVTGTISGSAKIAGIYGSVDLTGSTVNAAQVCLVQGNLAVAPTVSTDLSKTHGLGITNGTAAVLNSQIYLTGDASYLLETSGLTTAVATPGGSGPSGNLRTLKVYINGAAYYILAATTYS